MLITVRAPSKSSVYPLKNNIIYKDPLLTSRGTHWDFIMRFKLCTWFLEYSVGWMLQQWYRGVILSDRCISSLNFGLSRSTSVTWSAYTRFVEERSFVLYVAIESLHVHRFQATKRVIDRIRICRTHLLTVEKVEEIDAKLETPARKMLNSSARIATKVLRFDPNETTMFQKVCDTRGETELLCTGVPMRDKIIGVHDEEEVNPKPRSVQRWSWISSQWITEYAW